jgi:hypothetical protein
LIVRILVEFDKSNHIGLEDDMDGPRQVMGRWPPDPATAPRRNETTLGEQD